MVSFKPIDINEPLEPLSNTPVTKFAPISSEEPLEPISGAPVPQPTKATAKKSMFDKFKEQLFAIPAGVTALAASPELRKQRGEVIERSLAAPVSGVQEAAMRTAYSASPETFPKAPEKVAQLRKEQAELDAMQEKTPLTAGLQTAAAVGSTLPLAGVAPLSGAVKSTQVALKAGKYVPTMSWLKTTLMGAEQAGAGYVAGQIQPTAAKSPTETPEQAMKQSQRTARDTAAVGGAVGAVAPFAGPLVAATTDKVLKPVYDVGRSIAGSTSEATSRLARDWRTARSQVAGKPVSTTEIADELAAAKAQEQAVNKQFGVDVSLPSSEATGGAGNRGFFDLKKKNVAAGAERMARSGSIEPTANTLAAKNQAEMQALMQKSRPNATPQELAAIETEAKDLATSPQRLVEQRAIGTPSELTVEEVAQRLSPEKFDEINKQATALTDAEYAKIPRRGTLAATTHDTIGLNIDEINTSASLSKGEQAAIARVLEEPMDNTSTQSLLDLKASLDSVITRLKREPATARAAEQLMEIRDAVKRDLYTSPDTEIATAAKNADEFYRQKMIELFEQPSGRKGSMTGGVLSQETPMGRAATPEAVSKEVLSSSQNIKDYIRAAEFTGMGNEAKADVTAALQADLRETLRTNPKNIGAAYDNWALKNKTQIQAAEADQLFLSYRAAAIDNEKAVATATKLMGGTDAAESAIKKAMSSPEKMQELVAFANTVPNKDAVLKGFKQLMQEEIERGSTAVAPDMAGKYIKNTTYFQKLLDDPKTRQSLEILWGKDADNLTALADIIKRTSAGPSPAIPLVESKAVADDVAKGAAAQFSGARTIAVGAIDTLLNNLSNREYNRVINKALVDKDFAMEILRAYKDPTPTTFTGMQNALKTIVPAGVAAEAEADNAPNPKFKVPNAVKDGPYNTPSSGRTRIIITPQKKSELPVEEKQYAANIVMNDASGEIGPAKKYPKLTISNNVPYKKEYSNMLGKLKSNDHRRVGNFIIEEAAKQKVDPKLALNIAYAESGIEQVKEKSGKTSAYGVFQLTEAASKDARKILGNNKLSRYKLKDNVIKGIAYIKHTKARLEKATGKPVPDFMVYSAYHQGVTGMLTLLNPANKNKAAAKLLPAAAKANPKFFYNPKSGKPYSTAKVLQNLKDYYESKRLG